MKAPKLVIWAQPLIFTSFLDFGLELTKYVIVIGLVSASVLAQDDDLSLDNLPGDVAFVTADVKHTTVFPDYSTKCTSSSFLCVANGCTKMHSIIILWK